MRIALLAAAATLVATAASAQVAPPPLKTFASSAEVTALIAKAKAGRKEGQALVSQPLLSLAPYRANLEYRTLPAAGVVHPGHAEFMYVISGSGVLTTGGALVDPKPAMGGNITGPGITGGTATPLAAGDLSFVPQNTPHQFTVINGEMALITMNVPRTPAP